MTNLYEVLRAGFSDALDDVMLVVPDGEQVTYRAVCDRAARMATVLKDHGATAGDRVVVQVDKSIDAVALYLGCLHLGVVYVPLNRAYTNDEVEYLLADADPAIFVSVPGHHSAVLTLGADGEGSLADTTAAASPHGHVTAREPGDIAAMLYTSGTTGRPKGAMLTHGGLAANARSLHRAWGFRRSDVLLHILPIFHVHGLFVALHCAMLSGCAVRFHTRFDVADTITDLENATVMMGVPTHYSRLLGDERLDPDSCDGMRLFTSGSAPMTTMVHDEFAARTGHRIVERYGLTETGILTSNPLQGDRVAGTVGYALDGVELRIRDDRGRIAVVGETGVVEARTDSCCAGYWNKPDAYDQVTTSDGYFSTGDIGRLAGGGRLTLEGRSSDMIISGGYNVYPKEIELVLDGDDAVTESAVVGVPHPDLGEAVFAVIVTDRSEFVPPALDGHLAGFKHPKDYVVVDRLPRNTMGKVMKGELRRRYRDRFVSER